MEYQQINKEPTSNNNQIVQENQQIVDNSQNKAENQLKNPIQIPDSQNELKEDINKSVQKLQDLKQGLSKEKQQTIVPQNQVIQADQKKEDVQHATIQASHNQQKQTNHSSYHILGQSTQQKIDLEPQPQTQLTQQKQGPKEENIEKPTQLKNTTQNISEKITQEKPITVKIFQEKIAESIQFKNKGNSFFKQKNYVEAIKNYTAGLQLLDPSHFYAATQDQCKKMAQLSSNLLCNIGFCYFNSHDMVRADLYFTEAIVINPKYTKALHKRALTRFELKKYDTAMEDIKIAFNLEKANSEIHAAYSKILQKYNEQAKKNKQKLKQLSSKIFNNDTQKSETASSKLNKKVQKQEETNRNQDNQKKEGGWSWASVASFAGAAALIGVGIYKAFGKH